MAGFGNLPGEMAFHEVKDAKSYPIIASTRCAIPCPWFVTHRTLASPVCRMLKLQGSARSCASACSAHQHHQEGKPLKQATGTRPVLWSRACTALSRPAQSLCLRSYVWAAGAPSLHSSGCMHGIELVLAAFQGQQEHNGQQAHDSHPLKPYSTLLNDVGLQGGEWGAGRVGP